MGFRFLGNGGNPNTRSCGSSFEQRAIIEANSRRILSVKNSDTSEQLRMSASIDWFEIDDSFYTC